MSQTQQQHDQTQDDNQHPTRIQCKYHDCSEHGYKWAFHHGKYCSNTCETKHRGHQAIKDWRRSHTRCFTCMRRLKTIEPAKPDFEFTERGHGWTRREDGEFKLEFYDQSVTADAACGWQYRTEHAGNGEKRRFGMIVTGVICSSCGNTEHSHHETILADRDAIGRLVTLLMELDGWRVDPHVLHREYEKERDIDLAAGRAVSETEE